ncbi:MULTISPECIES: hypothetical protein [Corynebacterium]|uniref:hypothetical protein n=1 Tax=Corynebacterium TaxID=1716 RepID=UPI0019564229|nr:MULTISPECIES: hypothetical protein [Corynebacterium]MDN8624098.1 hypothetical protein [Corynebacterium kroppenstedtii]QRQ64124.1 hypothetical protein I6J23_05535 [Corynebacterium kroppenstedtii]
MTANVPLPMSVVNISATRCPRFAYLGAQKDGPKDLPGWEHDLTPRWERDLTVDF